MSSSTDSSQSVQSVMAASRPDTTMEQRSVGVRRVAASLPALPPDAQRQLRETASRLASPRASSESLTSDEREARMAHRLQAGRTLPVLVHLMQSGLLCRGPACPGDQLSPNVGLTATVLCRRVFILGRYTFRGQWRFDLAFLVARSGRLGSTHTIN